MDTSDPNIQRAIRNINATRKTSPFPWTRNEPHVQSYYMYSIEKEVWLPYSSAGHEFRGSEDISSTTPIKTLMLYSWNIDFMLPLPTERMSAALAHLESLIFPSSSSSTTPPAIPTLILLQELLLTDLILIQSMPWIRSHFHLTDPDSTNWESGYYGSAILIDKRLPISGVFRVHYDTRMGRDGLFVDISLPQMPPKMIRICNTHLESLAFSPPLRPAQLATAAKYMHAPEPTFSLLAGDLNAIQPFDRTLHTDSSLTDAYLALGGAEDSDDGYTWGQMAQTHLRERFGCSRMDKVLYCGEGVEVKQLERFGLDVIIEGEEEAQMLIDQGLEKAWVTDHLGLRCELKVAN
jgi:tyrosyl-DNA phosphodiesterase 2